MSPTLFTHLSGIDFSIPIIWTSPFPFKVFIYFTRVPNSPGATRVKSGKFVHHRELRTHENSDVLNTLDEIYLVFTSKK